MIRKFLAVSALTGLSACSGGEFLFPAEEEEVVETASATSSYTLEVNRLEYDEGNDQVVVNNLPFDGPDGVYDRVLARTEVDGFGVYRSLQTAETGQRTYYAVFRKTDNGTAAAIATGSYADVGFGGTAVSRTNDLTVMPTTGEYVYTGLYGGLRTFSDRGGIELVKGDVLLEIDIADFDNVGAVEGRVTNRVAYNVNGVPLQPLPNIIFATTTITAATGVIDEGSAVTRNGDGTTRDSGTYQGLFVGANGEEIVGTVNITGSFYAYQIFEAVEVTDAEGNVTTEQQQLSYAQYLAIQASGNTERLASITITEEAQGFNVRELGAFTAAD
jgi:hypothetical protein